MLRHVTKTRMSTHRVLQCILALGHSMVHLTTNRIAQMYHESSFMGVASYGLGYWRDNTGNLISHRVRTPIKTTNYPDYKNCIKETSLREVTVDNEDEADNFKTLNVYPLSVRVPCTESFATELHALYNNRNQPDYIVYASLSRFYARTLHSHNAYRGASHCALVFLMALRELMNVPQRCVQSVRSYRLKKFMRQQYPATQIAEIIYDETANLEAISLNSLNISTALYFSLPRSLNISSHIQVTILMPYSQRVQMDICVSSFVRKSFPMVR